MKLKHFIFAFLAMLSFAFSGFAQTVSTMADLKTALQATTSSEIVLGSDIEQTSLITIPKGVSHTLNLNGHNVTAKSTFRD